MIQPNPNPPDPQRLPPSEQSAPWNPQIPNAVEPESRLIPTPREAFGLVLLSLTLYAAFSIIDNASWVRGLPPLILPILLALALGRYVAGKPRRTGYPLVLAAGAVVTLGLGLPFLDNGAHTVFGLFFLAMAWFTAHLALRLSHSRLPILLSLPGLIVTLIALAFLDDNYFFHLPLYLIASAPAVAFFHLQANPGLGRKAVLAAAIAVGILISLVAVAFSWPSPTPNDPVRPAAASALEEPIYELVESGSGLFKNIPSRKNWLRFDLQPALPFTSPVELGETVVMRVSSPQAHRWRVRVYDTYTPWGWISFPDAPRTPEDLPSQIPSPEPQSQREDVRIEVRLFSSNTHVATAGLPLRSNASGLIEFSPQPAFNLNLDDSQPFYLPPDIVDLRQRLLNEPSPTLDALESDLSAQGLSFTVPPTIEAPLLESDLIVHRTDAGSYPTSALIFTRRQNPPRSYAALGSVSAATPDQLRTAGRDYDQGSIAYPDWITDRYLQLPPDFPQSVSDLAIELAKDHDNSYDAAISIQTYLHTLSYDEDIIPPPPGVDAVEWFLSTQRVGFCSYFASSMITMLRSLGIPARLVVGFAPGEYDDARDSWTVRTKDYHAWPEVYFPRYGWVEFEPTPSSVQPSLQNLGFRTATTAAANIPVEECFGDIFMCEEEEDPGGGTEEFNLDDFDFTPMDRPLTAQGGSPIDLLFHPYVLWPLVALTITAFAIIAANLYLRFLTRRLGLPILAFSGMSLLAGLAGVSRNASETPTEYGRRIAERLPRYAPLVNAIVAAYEKVSYARDKHLDDETRANLRWSWGIIRWPFLRLTLRRLIPLLPH